MKKIVKSLFFSAMALLIVVACSEDKPQVAPVAPAKFAIDLSTKDFGELEVEKTVSQTFKVTNKGGQNLELKSFDLVGTNASEFSTNGVKTSVKAAETYSFTVSFKPTESGNKTAKLNIVTNVGNKTITLQGKATPNPVAVFSITPTSKNFGSLEVNKEAKQNFTITNSGNADLTITGISLDGANKGEFVAPSLSTAKIIAAGKTYTFEVKFKPTTTGGKTVTLKLATSVGEKTVGLTGSGMLDASQALHIPDTNFRNMLLAHGRSTSINGVPSISGVGGKIDADENGVITVGEANAYRGAIQLTMSWLSVSNLKGIEAFTNIKSFYISVDINNLNTNSLDFSMFTRVEYISVVGSNSKRFSQITLPNINTVKYLDFRYNSLQSVNLTPYTNLEELYIQGNNDIQSLDISTNKKIKKINVSNTKIPSLDLRYLKNSLIFLSLNATNVTSLNVSGFSKLEFLYVQSSKLSKLDLSNNKALRSFYSLQSPTLKCVQIPSGFTPPSSWGVDNTNIYSTTPCP